MIKTLPILMVFAGALAGQSFPDGEGKAVTMDKCGGCHSLEEVWAHKDSEQGWAKLIAYMVSRGMVVTEDERKIILQYLVKAFPEDKAEEKKERYN